MRKVQVVSYHIYPDKQIGARRPSELSIFLREKGFDVSVFAGLEGQSSASDPRMNRIRTVYIRKKESKLKEVVLHIYKRLKKAPAQKAVMEKIHASDSKQQQYTDSGVLQKIKRQINAIEGMIDGYKVWSLKLFFRLLRETKNRSLIISSGPPMSSFLAVYFVKKFKSDVLWIADMRDPWNRISGMHAGASRLRTFIEDWSEKTCLQSADVITVASPGIKRDITERLSLDPSRIEVVFNGFDYSGDISQVRAQSSDNSNESLNLVYAGTLYFNRDPFPLFEAIKQVNMLREGQPKVKLYLYGDCSFCFGIDVAKWLTRNGLGADVLLPGKVSSQELARIYQDADVLVNFAQEQKRQIPGKTFEYMLYGKPMLHFSEQDSDSGKIISELAIGYVLDDKVSNIVKVLNDLLGEKETNGRLVLRDTDKIAQYDRRIQNEKIVTLIQKLSKTNG